MPVAVKSYKDTGLRYIEGLKQVLFERGGVKMSLDEFREHSKAGTLENHVASLINMPTRSGFDFNWAIATGQCITVASANELRAKEAEKKQTQTNVAVKEPLPPVLQKIIDTPSPKQPEPPVPAVPKTKSLHDSVVLLLFVMVVVGVGSMIMSAYHIIAYFLDGGRPEIVAYTTGAVMTLFSAFAFTAARSFYTTGKVLNQLSGYLIGIAFVLFGVIVVLFAMFSTIKVNYDQFNKGAEDKMQVVVTESTAVVEAKKQNSFAESELARIDGEILDAKRKANAWEAKYNAEVAKGEEAIASLKTRYWNEYIKAKDAIKALNDERKPFANRMTDDTKSVAAAEKKATDEATSDTIFGLFKKLFGIPEDVLRFIVYVIPSIFYDLMCPFALTVSIILFDKRREEKGDSK